MSDLTRFRDYARKMAGRDHLLDCPSLEANRPFWQSFETVTSADGQIQALRWMGPPPPLPECDGCVTVAERALWTRLADEADAYLDREPEETLL